MNATDGGALCAWCSYLDLTTEAGDAYEAAPALMAACEGRSALKLEMAHPAFHTDASYKNVPVAYCPRPPALPHAPTPAAATANEPPLTDKTTSASEIHVEVVSAGRAD